MPNVHVRLARGGAGAEGVRQVDVLIEATLLLPNNVKLWEREIVLAAFVGSPLALRQVIERITTGLAASMTNSRREIMPEWKRMVTWVAHPTRLRA